MLTVFRTVAAEPERYVFNGVYTVMNTSTHPMRLPMHLQGLLVLVILLTAMVASA